MQENPKQFEREENKMQDIIFTAEIYHRIIEAYKTNPAFKDSLLKLLNNTSKGEHHEQSEESGRNPER